MQRDARGAELLSQIVTEREEKASIATGSNLPFSEWGSIISDPRLADDASDKNSPGKVSLSPLDHAPSAEPDVSRTRPPRVRTPVAPVVSAALTARGIPAAR